MGDALPDFERNALSTIPVQAGGLYPISDVWYIEPSLDAPERLRVHIAQFAREIAEEAGIGNSVEVCDTGLGFVCPPECAVNSPFAAVVLGLLQALCGLPSPVFDGPRLAADLGTLLQGGGSFSRLSDTGLVKLFRLLRLARRLLDLEIGNGGNGP